MIATNMARPGLTVQPPLVQNQVIQPTFGQTIPTSSIKYAAPTLQAQPMIAQSNMIAPVQTYQTTTAPVVTNQQVITSSAVAAPVHTSYHPTQLTTASPVVASTQVVGASTQVVGGRCPPPVQGQPIVIEGVVAGAQSYIEPVKQTVLLQGAQVRPEYSQVQKGESKFEYIPYEQVITEYDQMEKRIRIPINKYITEYQVIDHQVEYHPEITYQTETDYRPNQRQEEEVVYQSQLKRVEHGFNQSMRTSQRIEGAVNIMGNTSVAVQQPTTIVQSTSPVQVQAAQTYQTTSIQPQVIATQPQVVTSGVAYSQVPAQQVAYTQSQIPVAQQWPTANWTNVQQVKRKST